MATLLLILIYAAFISLGFPDALLGAGWPAMQPEFNVPYGQAGLVQMVISGGTIIASIFSGRILRRFGTGKVTVVSVALTAIALFGFACSPSFGWLFLAAIPLGLGAGAVDAGLNAFVATHYESRHMSWLHCFWGIGALSGPLLISVFLAQGSSWRYGYLSIAILQVLLVGVLIAAIPLWGKVRDHKTADVNHSDEPALSFANLLGIKGVKWALVTFLFYCSIESLMGLWGGSFLFKVKGLDAASAAAVVSLFYASIALGRFLTGFVTYKLSNAALIRGGILMIIVGIILMLLPLPLYFTLAGFFLVGLGCAPVFPCLLHETPVRFGAKEAPALMGVQMAAAYIGSTFAPPLFGVIASWDFLELFPVFLLGCGMVLLLGAEKTGNLRAR